MSWPIAYVGYLKLSWYRDSFSLPIDSFMLRLCVLVLLGWLSLSKAFVRVTNRVIKRLDHHRCPRPARYGWCLPSKSEDKDQGEPSAFDKVASMGLAGILAITAAEAIFWALGVPLAEVYYKVTTGDWIDLSTSDGQIKAAGFSFGYGGFATLILQYRVTLFAIPLVPIMQRYVVEPGKRLWGDKFGDRD